MNDVADVLRSAAAIGDVEMTELDDEAEFIVLVARRDDSGALTVVAQLPGSDAVTPRALKAAAKTLRH
jgi:hypothetical protein